jgi:formate dehydrogenase major subunit
VTEKDYAEVPRRARVPLAVRPADVRRGDFEDVWLGLPEEQAREEAARCLSCGCHDYGNCSLIRWANAYRADGKRWAGQKHPSFTERRLEVIERNQGKCLLCNLCVRTCEVEAGKGILGLVGRGFETVVKPAFRQAEALAGCAACHRCVDVCPTGALRLLPR